MPQRKLKEDCLVQGSSVFTDYTHFRDMLLKNISTQPHEGSSLGPDLSGASSPKLLPWKQHCTSIYVQLHRNHCKSCQGCWRTQHGPAFICADGRNVFHRLLPAQVQEQLLLPRQGQYIQSRHTQVVSTDTLITLWKVSFVFQLKLMEFERLIH